MIDGVKVKNLKINKDERGRLMEILRDDDNIFKKFGQVYISTINPDYVKGWHLHKKQTDNMTCIKGKVKLVLYDSRENSNTKGKLQEFFLNLENPLLIQIPPNVYHGVENLGSEEAVIVNIPTEHYNREQPDEHRLPFNSKEIPYKWQNNKGG